MIMMNLLIIFILTIQNVKAEFYEKEQESNLSRVLLEKSAVPSALACTHYCYRLDREAGIAYDGNICRCVKKEQGSQKDKSLVTGMFLNTKKLVREKPVKEVKVIEKEVNIALKKPASQINGVLEKQGNDGNEKSYSKTYGGPGPKWWQVDLLKPRNFIRVEIVLSNFFFVYKMYEDVSIEVRNSVNEAWRSCKRFRPPTAYRLSFESCDDPTTNVRYFRIVHNRPSVADYKFQLQEFRVFIVEKTYVTL